jgi:NADPH2:quinone reductase
MSLPASMSAIEISEPGGPEVLRLVRRPLPLLGAGELLIAVEAAGVNRPDVLQRKGEYPPPPGASDLPGLDVAGRVASVGLGVSRYKPGDAVCALVAGGGYAGYCAAPEAQCLPVPKGFSMVEAAALPETFFTVWHNLFERGRLGAGEAVLIHGGTSGIGTAAIQLAKAFGAAPIFATAGSRDKCHACERLGATRGIDYKTQDFVKVVKDATGGRGVDVVLDMVGGDYLNRDLRIMGHGGRLVMIAFKLGSTVSLDCTLVQDKEARITGSRLRPRPVAEKGRLAAEVAKHVWPLIAAGKVVPVIDSTFPLAEVQRAHERMESGVHIGKILLTM